MCKTVSWGTKGRQQGKERKERKRWQQAAAAAEQEPAATREIDCL